MSNGIRCIAHELSKGKFGAAWKEHETFRLGMALSLRYWAEPIGPSTVPESTSVVSRLLNMEVELEGVILVREDKQEEKEAKKQARKEWEDEQLLKLWPVN